MSEYKYNLNSLIRQTDKTLTIKTIGKLLEESYNIPVSTFRKHCAIKKNEDSTIKEDHLAIYAVFFNTTVEKLRNYELPVGKSLKQLKGQTDRDLQESIKNQLGLAKA